MTMRDGVLTGEIESYCTAQDKLRFFLNTCASFGILVSDTVAIGDSKSDHPVFQMAGKSIALNADEETKKIATHSIDTDNLLDILPFFE